MCLTGIPQKLMPALVPPRRGFEILPLNTVGGFQIPLERKREKSSGHLKVRGTYNISITALAPLIGLWHNRPQ